jgi:hypothetical protein
MHRKMSDWEGSSSSIGEIEPESIDFALEQPVSDYDNFGVSIDMDQTIVQASLFFKMSEEARELLTFILTGPTDLVWNYYVPACKAVYQEIRKFTKRKSNRAMRTYRKVEGRTNVISKEDVERRIEYTSGSVLIEIREYLRYCVSGSNIIYEDNAFAMHQYGRTGRRNINTNFSVK